MLKNKGKIAAIAAVVCLAAAGAVGYKVYSGKKDNSLTVKNSEVQSSANVEKKDNNTDAQSADSTKDKSSESNKKSEVTKTSATSSSASSEKKESLSGKSNSQQSKKTKSSYLAKLAEIEKQDKECGLDSAKTTVDMNEAQSKRYKLWDGELNTIYSELRKTLPKDKMAALEKEEKAWISQKEANAEKAAKKYEGGSLASVERAGSLVNDTKDRCYYLVNNYM